MTPLAPAPPRNSMLALTAQLEHGEWEAWLQRELNWSSSSALRMIQVTEQFKSVNMTDLHLDVSTLYLLAAPSTPVPARQEAIAQCVKSVLSVKSPPPSDLNTLNTLFTHMTYTHVDDADAEAFEERAAIEEYDENEVRKDFSITEKVAIGQALEAEIAAENAARQQEGRTKGGQTGGRGRPKRPASELAEGSRTRQHARSPDTTNGNSLRENFPQANSWTREQAAKKASMSGPTYSKAKAVVQAATANPERFGDLPARDTWAPVGRLPWYYGNTVQLKGVCLWTRTNAYASPGMKPRMDCSGPIVASPWSRYGAHRGARPSRACRCRRGN